MSVSDTEIGTTIRRFNGEHADHYRGSESVDGGSSITSMDHKGEKERKILRKGDTDRKTSQVSKGGGDV